VTESTQEEQSSPSCSALFLEVSSLEELHHIPRLLVMEELLENLLMT